MPKHDKSQSPVPTAAQMQTLETLAHRVQSAVALMEGQAKIAGARYQEIEPKHLRVGVNSALVEATGLATLLFRKGLFTSDEYFDALIEAWESEVDRYLARVKSINPRFSV